MKKVLLIVLQLTFSSIISGQNKLILFNANLIDGIANVEKRNMMIFISNGKIESIKKDGLKPKGYDLIDLNGMYLLPGFIDAHTHIRTIESANRALESGVTTARSASTPNFQDISIREMVKTGALIGPEMIAAGVFVTPNLGETILADPGLGDLHLSLIHISEPTRPY